MTLRTIAVLLVYLSWLVSFEISHAAQISEEQLEAVLASEHGDLVLIEELRSMTANERRDAVQSVLSILEKYKQQPNSEDAQLKIIRILPVLPRLGSPNAVASVLSPMISSSDPTIRSGAYRTLSELDGEVGLDIITQNIDELFSKLPNTDASISDDQARQTNADAVAYLYSLRGLLNSQSTEKRRVGLDSFNRLKQKYEGTVKGQEIINSFIGELQTLGANLEPNVKTSATENFAVPTNESSSTPLVGRGHQSKAQSSSPKLKPQSQSKPSGFPVLPVTIAGVAILGIVLYLLRRKST